MPRRPTAFDRRREADRDAYVAAARARAMLAAQAAAWGRMEEIKRDADARHRAEMSASRPDALDRLLARYRR